LTQDELYNQMKEIMVNLKSLASDYLESVILLKQDLHDGDMQYLESLNILNCWEDMLCCSEELIDMKNQILRIENQKKKQESK